MTAPVVISGLGPTGLSMAHHLACRDHPVIVLERDISFYGRARAVYTDDECMRILQGAGIADELAQDMIHDCPGQWMLPDGRVLATSEMLSRANGWPMMNFLYQPSLEAKMEELLRRYPNVQLLRGREVVGIEQDAESVTIHHQAADGSGTAEALRAKWFIGCDGGRSITRKLLGITMTGDSFPERWLVLDLKVEDAGETLRHLPYFSFVCDPDQPIVCCPQPGGHHRLEFLLRDDDDVEEMQKPETVRRLISRFIDPDKMQVLRALVYTFNALNAERWRVGRILLAGDAAHMTPQFMGQGMSSGIRDVGNLAWKLDLVLRGEASAKLLDSYERERKPHAQAMIDVSIRMMRFVSVRKRWVASLRNAVIRAMLTVPQFRSFMKRGGFKPGPDMKPTSYAGLARSRAGGPEGRLIPQPDLRDSLGRIRRMDDVLGTDFALIGLDCDPWARLSNETRNRWEALGTQSLIVWDYGRRPQGLRSVLPKSRRTQEFEDVNHAFLPWCRRHHVRPGDIIILRPDRIVAGAAAADTLSLKSAQLFSMFGPRSEPLKTTEPLKGLHRDA